MTSPWTDGEYLNAATMYARTTALLNGFPAGFIGEQSGASITVATTGTTYLGDASVTVVVPNSGRRYRSMVRSSINSATVPARYTVAAAYNLGSTMDRSATAGAGFKSAGGSVNTFGAQASVANAVAGSAGVQSIVVWGTVLLPAGTYTFSVAITRNSGGAATDTANAFLTLEDMGES